MKFYSILLTGLSGVGRSFILCGLVLVVFVAVLPGVLCLCLCFARFFIVVWRFDLEAVLRVRICAISCFCGCGSCLVVAGLRNFFVVWVWADLAFCVLLLSRSCFCWCFFGFWFGFRRWFGFVLALWLFFEKLFFLKKAGLLLLFWCRRQWLSQASDGTFKH